MSESEANTLDRPPIIDRIPITAEIVSAFVSNNSVPASDLPTLIHQVHDALGRIGQSATAPSEAQKQPLTPAVPIKKSVTDDFIICLEDGKKFKSLKRHLMSHYGMTPDEYRAKWGLPGDYPMVAPNYSASRSELAKQMGLGQMQQRSEAPAVAAAPKVEAKQPEPQPTPPAKGRGRPRKAAAA